MQGVKVRWFWIGQWAVAYYTGVSIAVKKYTVYILNFKKQFTLGNLLYKLIEQHMYKKHD